MTGKLVQLLRGQGLRKGVLGGNNRWLTIWLVLTTVGFVRKRLQAKPVIERMTLKPGETITITDLGVSETGA